MQRGGDGHTEIEVVLGLYRLTSAQLVAPNREPRMVEARTVAMRLMWDRGMAFAAIGRVLGRGHDTVMHHLARLEKRATEDEHRMLVEAQRLLTLREQKATHGVVTVASERGPERWLLSRRSTCRRHGAAVVPSPLTFTAGRRRLP